jgi:hypothetical protein
VHRHIAPVTDFVPRILVSAFPAAHTQRALDQRARLRWILSQECRMQVTRSRTARFMARCVALIALTTPLVSRVSAQSPLVGSIVDDVGRPIEGARISIRGLKTHAYSDAEGRFVVPDAPTGLIVVLAQPALAFPAVEMLRHKGNDSLAFIVQRISVREDTSIALQAERNAIRLADRYGRAAAASRSATVFTDRDIALRTPSVTTDLFVGVVGFRVNGSGSNGTVTSARDGCYPTVWIDDVEQVQFSLNEVRPSAIKVMLIWNGYALIPPGLRSVRAAPTCGAVLIVTKS